MRDPEKYYESSWEQRAKEQRVGFKWGEEVEG